MGWNRDTCILWWLSIDFMQFYKSNCWHIYRISSQIKQQKRQMYKQHKVIGDCSQQTKIIYMFFWPLSIGSTDLRMYDSTEIFFQIRSTTTGWHMWLFSIRPLILWGDTQFVVRGLCCMLCCSSPHLSSKKSLALDLEDIMQRPDVSNFHHSCREEKLALHSLQILQYETQQHPTLLLPAFCLSSHSQWGGNRRLLHSWIVQYSQYEARPWIQFLTSVS